MKDVLFSITGALVIIDDDWLVLMFIEDRELPAFNRRLCFGGLTTLLLETDTLGEIGCKGVRAGETVVGERSNAGGVFRFLGGDASTSPSLSLVKENLMGVTGFDSIFFRSGDISVELVERAFSKWGLEEI
jgi:hypothetical protein